MVLRVCLAAAFLLSTPALGATVQERRDAIAQVQELLSDPDPSQRLANMEQLLSSGDGQRIQRALRIGFSSDDAELRSLAMRAYIANLKQLTFQITPTDTAAKAYATTDDQPTALQEMYKRYPFMQNLVQMGFQFVLPFGDFSADDNTGKIAVFGQPPFTIMGDRFTTVLRLGPGDCGIEFRPTSGLRFEGTMACNNMPRLKISSPLF